MYAFWYAFVGNMYIVKVIKKLSALFFRAHSLHFNEAWHEIYLVFYRTRAF